MKSILESKIGTSIGILLILASVIYTAAFGSGFVEYHITHYDDFSIHHLSVGGQNFHTWFESTK